MKSNLAIIRKFRLSRNVLKFNFTRAFASQKVTQLRASALQLKQNGIIIVLKNINFLSASLDFPQLYFLLPFRAENLYFLQEKERNYFRLLRQRFKVFCTLMKNFLKVNLILAKQNSAVY